MVFRSCQSFQFLRQITWFFENNRTLSKFKYRILHYLISIIKSPKKRPIKGNFILNTQAILNENKIIITEIFKADLNLGMQKLHLEGELFFFEDLLLKMGFVNGNKVNVVLFTSKGEIFKESHFLFSDRC